MPGGGSVHTWGLGQQPLGAPGVQGHGGHPARPRWLRALGGQEGSHRRVGAGSDAGHVQPQSPPECRCQGTRRALPPQASQLGISGLLSTRWRSVLNFFEATPPTQPLQHRCGCAIPRLSYLHQRLTKHSCLHKWLQPLGGEKPQPPSPAPGCPATTSHAFTHWQGPGSHHFANSGHWL